jgi:hypothetical protein
MEKNYVFTLSENMEQSHCVRIGIVYSSSTRLHLVRRSRIVSTLAQLQDRAHVLAFYVHSGTTKGDVHVATTYGSLYKVDETPISNVSLGTLSSDYAGHTVDKDGHGVFIEYNHVHPINGSATINTSLSGQLSIIALRNALAAQKYKEIQLANDVDFQSQVEAHFGIKPNDKDENSLFIGGSSSMININEQINQNLSGDNKATYGAAPQGNGSASIKFTAKTFGVVIGIYRCTPVLDFAHIGIDRTLFKTDASDFVIPELDSIGMQQTFRCEVAAPSPYNDEFTSFKTGDGTTPDMSETYGYAPRYSEYKTSYDRYNGGFCHSLKSWVTGLNFSVAENRKIRTVFIGYILKVQTRIIILIIFNLKVGKLLWKITIAKQLQKFSRLSVTITTSNKLSTI